MNKTYTYGICSVLALLSIVASSVLNPSARTPNRPATLTALTPSPVQTEDQTIRSTRRPFNWGT